MREIDLFNFYSNDMVVSKENINLNYLKLTYQKISIKDLEKKHKNGLKIPTIFKSFLFLFNKLSIDRKIWI